MKKRYCLISHTHWDREWYLPFENFRMRLVDLIDNLLDILKEDKEYRFHLDAQTIVLEDYLAIRPSSLDRGTCRMTSTSPTEKQQCATS